MTTPAPAAPAAPSAPAPPAASAALNAPVAPPASAAPVTPPLTPGAPATPPQGDWTSTLDEDSKGYVQNKGFKTPNEVLNSYRQLEKTFGVPQDRLLKLPENMDSPEGRAIMERLGMPKTPAEYGLDKLVPKEGGDPKLAEWAAEVFHKTGLPQKAAEEIITKWNERSQAAQKANQENIVAAITQGDAALKKDWGAAYEQNIQIAKAGMRALELKPEEVDTLDRIMGRERLFKKLQSIGKGIGEATFVSGRPAADGVLAPEQARQKIKELGMDSNWVKRFSNGDSEAKALMERMQRMAYPGEITV